MSATRQLSTNKEKIFADLDLSPAEELGVSSSKWSGSGGIIETHDPATGAVLGTVKSGTREDYEAAVAAMGKAKLAWADKPAPLR
jgi:aldehyde dehydrogenase (NAD+)